MAKLIPIPETDAMKAQLKDIPAGKRAEFIRACITLVQGSEKERQIAKAEIDLIKMRAEC